MKSPFRNLSRSQVAIVASVTSLFVVLALFGLGLLAGNVTGVEFSPDDFSRRQFSYTRIPWLKLTVVGKRYFDIETELDLAADGWIAVTPPKTWHLVAERQLDRQPVECDARFLVDLLDLVSDDFSNYWIDWNQRYPDFAKVFWPIIAEMARDELYLAIPESVETALMLDRKVAVKDKPGSAQDFERQLKIKLQAAYQLYGKIDENSGRAERATYRLGKAELLKTELTD